MNFIEPFVEGFVTGIGLSLMLGTVFFAIIQNSVTHGYHTGVLISVGVIVSDIMFISLALFSTFFADFLEIYQTEVTWVGAFLLMAFGLSQFLKKVKSINGEHKLAANSVQNTLFFIGNGFFLNVINPVNFFVWLSISTMLSISFDFSMGEKITFFSGTLLAIFATESTLAIFAGQVKKWMNEKRAAMVNKVSGSIFMLIGLYLLLR